MSILSLTKYKFLNIYVIQHFVNVKDNSRGPVTCSETYETRKQLMEQMVARREYLSEAEDKARTI